MDNQILERIRDLLTGEGIAYREVEHGPTHTSEESASARGESVAIGGKALVIKTGDAFRLFVLSAALKLDSSAIKQKFNAKKVRFATPEELYTLTGLLPGAVPPFGQPILPFELYVDPSVLRNDKIAFNAGSLETSIIFGSDDYARVAKPTVFAFAIEVAK
jgi:Ala-tRNA(Pro) deacylase